MYKLGPIHQGIVERGSRRPATRISFGLARIGLSLVMVAIITAILPIFPSLFNEKDDGTYLVPGINLHSVGTIRDAQSKRSVINVRFESLGYD